MVDPSKSRESTNAPTILLTRVKVGENVVAAYEGIVPAARHSGGGVIDLAKAGGEVRIPPEHRRLELEFTALSFAGAENNTFRFRLRGMDEEWTETSARNAVYPRLSAGQYRFEVVGCNHEGVWNEVGAGVELIVVPFFWQTWWFRGVLAGVFTGMVVGCVRYLSFRRLRAQLRQLEAQAALHRERARIARDIHDDLGSNLTQISLIGELARQDSRNPEKVAEHVTKMSNTARRAVKALDEIVWAVNPRNDTLAHFIDYTGQYALDFLRVAGLRCRLDLPEDPPVRELSTDVRHNLFLVVKEAITNCVKHASASELRLQIEARDDALSVVVEDNGRGFERRQEDATADGLRNMRQRVADIGGECSILSELGAGTKVSVRLPWIRTGTTP